MKLQIKNILFVIVLTITSLGFSVPIKNKGNNRLFKIERSRDINEIIYEVNFDSYGVPVDSQPIKIYWLKKTRNYKTEPLTWIQKKYSYGLKFFYRSKLPKNEWQFQFVSYSKRTFKLKQSADKTYKVYTYIDNKEIEVSRIFIQIEGGSFWIPSIPFVKLYGIDPKTGKTITEIVKP